MKDLGEYYFARTFTILFLERGNLICFNLNILINDLKTDFNTSVITALGEAKTRKSQVLTQVVQVHMRSCLKIKYKNGVGYSSM